jgi:hypothetical protein
MTSWSLSASLLVLLLFCSTTLGTSPTQDRFTSCQPVDKFIEIKIKVATLPARATAAQRLAWVLAEIPGAAQIVLVPEDAILRNRILEILQLVRESGVELGVGRGGEASDQLEIQLADLDSIRPGLQIILPAGIINPPEPSDVGKIHMARVCLKYNAAAPPTRVEIVIRSAAAETSPVPNVPLLTLADAAPRFAGQPQGTIPVKIAFGRADLSDARMDSSIVTDEAAVARVQSELLAVAATSFDTAVTSGLLTPAGQPLVDRNSGQEVASHLERAIAQIYDLNGLDPNVRWGITVPKVGVLDDTAYAPWIISVSGVQLAQAVDIDVVKSPVEMEFDGTETEKKFTEKREKIRDQLRASHLSAFAARPGHIVTSFDIEKDQELLRSDKKNVKSVGSISSAGEGSPPQTLVYAVSRYLKSEKVLSLKLGAGYSPEEQFTGSVSLDETNFLGVAETVKLAYAGGPQTQRIRFTFDRPFVNNETQGWQVKTLGINVQYFSDDDTRFGNLTPDEIAMKEAGSSARFSVAYDSFGVLDHLNADCLDQVERKRTRVYLNVTPVFAYRDVNIKDDDLLLTITKLDPSLLPRARTQTTTLALDFSSSVTHDFRKLNQSGAGVLGFSVNGRLQRGFHFFGADYDFNKINVTLGAEFLFGFRSWRDLLLRYNRVMGTSTHGTPIFELQRLGGPLTVRGLEEGEVIGRKLSADQFEFGLNALLVWGLISRRSVAERLLSTDCSNGSQAPFDIRNAYLKFFYDRGRVHDSDSFLAPGNFSRTAEGYGAAIELRRLGNQNVNLSLGYAYSPQSALHKHGTIYTGVSYSF